MDIEKQLELTREEQLALSPTVQIDTSGAPKLGDNEPISNPRCYGLTDAEAIAWNEAKQAQNN